MFLDTSIKNNNCATMLIFVNRFPQTKKATLSSGLSN